jgi:hypothetical protein
MSEVHWRWMLLIVAVGLLEVHLRCKLLTVAVGGLETHLCVAADGRSSGVATS